MPKDKLKSLIMEVTGGAHDDKTVESTVSTFIKLKELADFDADTDAVTELLPFTKGSGTTLPSENQAQQRVAEELDSVGLNLAYTVNIVLPETTNPEVFNSIFKSLKENLLKR
ncbi:DUF5343 domain-containing protein [Hyphomicrobium sp. NDB2Meth4]|uniref:DUF5343 domain-containing protein n=1 Tax=Hyphomicrobium sp. NDB2Meth4 TaxID=1892846 RepID=UPI001114BDE9|nr:DUF5343 domain-containing protein [Hyphomicrobium sp. NDB2Meth4]